MSPVLRNIVGSIYEAKVLGLSRLDIALANAKAALAANAALKAEAQAELTRLNAFRDVEQRCFLSTRRRDFLRELFKE